MTDQTEQLEETIEAPEADVEIEAETDETTEPEQVEADAEAPEAVDEPVVTFGDDEPPSDDEPKSLRDKKFIKLRKEVRELKKELKDARSVEAGKAEEEAALGAEPTLEDHDYDAVKFRDALRKWDQAKSKQEAKAEAAKKAQEDHAQAYQAKLGEYQDSKAEFDADSFDEAEDVVRTALNVAQQSILIEQFGGNAAPLIHGLGRNDKRLKQLASISDPVSFAVAATRLESAMKVSQRKPKTVPETRPAGRSAGGLAGDNKLEKLREEAAKTGDMSKVMAYKRKLKAG